MSVSGSTRAWARGFDGEAPVRAPLSADDLAAIPAQRGVLLLEADGGAPVLLTTAADIRARMRGRLAPPDDAPRRRTADLREVARRIRWKRTFSHFETDWQFLELARRIYPKTYPDLLSIQPAWFVHADPDAACPSVGRTREVFGDPGRYLGPFPDGRSAQRFVEALQEVFDLCRHESILRRAPRGRACVYAQMGRCGAPCDGSEPMAAYRARVAQACRCAAGDRRTIRGRLQVEMRRCAESRRYERAAAFRSRLERLGELDKDAYRHVADAEDFRFVLIQPGPNRQTARTFLADRGAIRAGPDLAYPVSPKHAERLAGRMRTPASGPRRVGVLQRRRMGLVAHYLYVSAERRGLIVRAGGDLTGEALAEQIAAGADRLGLRPGRASKGADAGRGQTGRSRGR